MFRITSTALPESVLDEQLQSAGVNQDILSRVREAVARVLQENGASATLDSITLRQSESPELAAACRCVRYETRCYTIVECDDSGCRPVRRCSEECVQWECPT